MSPELPAKADKDSRCHVTMTRNLHFMGTTRNPYLMGRPLILRGWPLLGGDDPYLVRMTRDPYLVRAILTWWGWPLLGEDDQRALLGIDEKHQCQEEGQEWVSMLKKDIPHGQTDTQVTWSSIQTVQLQIQINCSTADTNQLFKCRHK